MKQTATVPVAIAKFAQGYEIQYTQMAASSALSIIPPSSCSSSASATS